MNLRLEQRESELSECLVEAFPRAHSNGSTRRSKLRRRESGSPSTPLRTSKLPHSRSGLRPRGARCAVVAIIVVTALFVAGVAFAQEKVSATRLIELAKSNSAELRGAIS